MESLICRRVSGRTKVVRGTQGNAYEAFELCFERVEAGQLFVAVRPLPVSRIL